jgi:hypothetical protein
MLFSTLWAYRTEVKTTTCFTSFHLVHGIEATLPIECEIPTLCTSIDLLPDTSPMDQCLLTLELLDDDHRSSLQKNEVAKKWSKATFDFHVNLHSFNEGDLILSYDISHDTHGKFESLWHGPSGQESPQDRSPSNPQTRISSFGFSLEPHEFDPQVLHENSTSTRNAPGMTLHLHTTTKYNHDLFQKWILSFVTSGVSTPRSPLLVIKSVENTNPKMLKCVNGVPLQRYVVFRDFGGF